MQNEYEQDTLISDEALGLGFNEEKLKKESSNIHLSLFLYLIISYAVVISVTVITAFILPEDKYATLATDSAFNIALSIVAQYLVGFPIFILIMRSFSKPATPLKEKMKLSELATLTLIAEALMLTGSIVGNYLNQIIGNIFNIQPENSLDTMLDGTPIWLIVVSVVILAPIVEEIIFRKMIIDRLSRFGGTLAVVVSSVAFALIHTNLYQFPYALAVGILLGYVYLRSGEVKYTIVIHMIMNFLGSVAILPVQDATVKIAELLPIIEAGGEVNMQEFIIPAVIVSVYSVIQMGLIGGGIAALVVYVTKKRRESGVAKFFPDAKRALLCSYINVGAILFVCLTLFLTGMALFSA